MKVKVTRAFLIGGARQEVGKEVDVPEVVGRELISYGKAVRAEDKPAPAAKTMTTKTAAAIVSGAKE